MNAPLVYRHPAAAVSPVAMAAAPVAVTMAPALAMPVPGAPRSVLGAPAPATIVGAPATLAAAGAAKNQPRAKAPCSAADLAPWLEAARTFEMNEDFDVRPPSDGGTRLRSLMQAMKDQSGGKSTIQALGDKIILSKLLENLGVPQMPILFETYTTVDAARVEQFISGLHQSKEADAFDIVIKPTHLSSGKGALILDRKKYIEKGFTAQKLVAHMQMFLSKRADDCESEALKSLVPGFVVQPRYRSSVEFEAPLEMRVVTLWGQARVGVWWWGRRGSEAKGQRTAWLVRRPKHPSKLSKDDTWEAIHEHTGKNDGFEAALAQFTEAMPLMAAAAEDIATGVGAPFLRSDFFVGSPKWGVRLNEVAYGSGVDLLWAPKGASPGTLLLDESPTFAQILHEGLKICQRHPADYFLSRLGASGSSYRASPKKEKLSGSMQSAPATPCRVPGIQVVPVSPDERRIRLDSDARQGMLAGVEAPPIPKHRCDTVYDALPMPLARGVVHRPAPVASVVRNPYAYPVHLPHAHVPRVSNPYSVAPMTIAPAALIAPPIQLYSSRCGY